MDWQWGKGPWKCFPYIQVSDVLCYKQIPIIYRISLLQISYKLLVDTAVDRKWNSMIYNKIRSAVHMFIIKHYKLKCNWHN